MSFNQIDGLWFLHDSFTVQQAAALIADFDPNTVRWNMNGGAWFENEHGLTESEGINRVTTAFTALVNAINGGTLAATIRRDARLQAWDEFPNIGENCRAMHEPDDTQLGEFETGVIYKESPDWSLTTITRTDLVNWLHSRGMRTGFFFPDASPDTPGYLDSKNPRYPRKLAAAVSAWMAVTEPSKKSPKQALDKWLREHATDFGLTDAAGNPINAAIEECSKVANWKFGGPGTA
jgi:hypothetical protein